ncbi:Carbamate kinase [hydrothermal vent metagenome]|uniref:Carbamate kinase n=1 Tax=hydrothermal vent metagenome TaxID=652676 RepID=A0A3B0SSI5_9ZZZZ
MPKLVIAIGGNSLIPDKDHESVQDQYAAAAATDEHIAGLIEQGWDVAISHGNGPQVGFILRRSELASNELHEIPLDYCGADTQGAIGYMLQQNLINDFRQRGIDKNVVTLVTQVEVDRNDPAFQSPSKPIGSFMDEDEAKRRRDEEGWDIKEDAGRGWRRVVASPQPKRIVELEVIKSLLDAGVVTIAVGGGGIPVIMNEAGDLEGIAAVIDKDLASALLASQVDADMLLISTAVEKVALNFGTPEQRWVDQFTLEEVKQYLDEGGHFAEGSMAPKMRAVVQFLEAGGKEALITNPENLERAVAGETGTRIVQ